MRVVRSRRSSCITLFTVLESDFIPLSSREESANDFSKVVRVVEKRQYPWLLHSLSASL